MATKGRSKMTSWRPIPNTAYGSFTSNLSSAQVNGSLESVDQRRSMAAIILILRSVHECHQVSKRPDCAPCAGGLHLFAKIPILSDQDVGFARCCGSNQRILHAAPAGRPNLADRDTGLSAIPKSRLAEPRDAEHESVS